MPRTTACLLPLVVALAACTASQPPAPTTDVATAPAAPTPAAEPVPAAQPAPIREFIDAPAEGRVVRANCKMGGCWWYRYETVQAEDSAAPRYRLQMRVGDSGPHPDPYPLEPQGVDIRWDAEPVEMAVACSKQAPLVQRRGTDHALALGPSGVSGAEQELANLYFATCHGESGDDGALARKFGYALR